MKKTTSTAAQAKAPTAQRAKASPPRKPARPPTEAKKPEKKPGAESAKGDTILAMLKAPGGATSIDIGKAVGWLPNSIRGFFWNLKKKGVIVTTTKEKGKPTVYAIVEPKKAKAAAEAPVGDVI